MPTGRSIPRAGRPPGGDPPIDRRYPIQVYPNPTCPIYPALASFLKVRGVSYLSYPIVDLMAANPMDWISTWRLINSP